MFKFLGRQIVRPYTKLAKDSFGSASNIKNNVAGATNVARDMVKEMREGVAHLKTDEGRATTNDPTALFKKLYTERGWTPETLAKQRRATVVHQIMFMIFALMAAAAGVWQFNLVTAGSFLMPLVCTALAMLAGAVFLARVGLMAWWRCQIDNQSILHFFEFVGRDDFYKNIINPFRFSGARS